MPYLIRCLSNDGQCRMQEEPLAKDTLDLALFWARCHEYGFQHPVRVEPCAQIAA